jgi:DNA polymerase I-like protein with 3'-5' exonuclease and polymerase domains
MDKIYIQTQEAWDVVREKALKEAKVGFDIETASLHPNAEIAGFSLYLPSADLAVYVPLNHKNAQNFPGVPSLLGIKMVVFYGSFDVGRWLYWYDELLTVVGDGYIATKMLQTMDRFSGVKALIEKYNLLPRVIEIEEVCGEGNYDFSLVELNQLCLDYTTQDAYGALRGEEEILKESLKRDKYPDWDAVYQLEMDNIPLLGLAELQGARVDTAELAGVFNELKTEESLLRTEICMDLNRDLNTFNPASPARLAAALFNKPDHEPKPLKKTQHQDLEHPGLGLESFSGTSVAVDTLANIADQHPVIEKLLRWKKLNAILTKDLPQVETWVDSSGYLRPKFQQVGEDGTSRIYSGGAGNFISLSKVVRKSIKPKEGCVFIHVDFEAAELRIAAAAANDRPLLKAFTENLDAHKITYLFSTNQITLESTPEEVQRACDGVTKAQRDTGKILNYAVIFGTMGYSVGMALGISQKEADVAIDKFWDSHPELFQWVTQTKNYASLHGRTQTLMGRIRQLKGIFAAKGNKKKPFLRQAVNTACQGTCGDILKIAMVRVFHDSRNVDSVFRKHRLRLVTPVFDAALYEANKEILDDPIAIDRLRNLFEVKTVKEGGVHIPMKIEMGISDHSWFDAMQSTNKVAKVTVT